MLKATQKTLILEYGPVDHAGRPLSSFNMYGIVKSTEQLSSLKKRLTEEYNRTRVKQSSKPAKVAFKLYEYCTATGSTMIGE